MAWNAKKTHKIFFSSEQLLPQTGPESDGPGLEYLDTPGPGRPFSGPGRFSTARSAFGVFICLYYKLKFLNEIKYSGNYTS